MTAQIDYYWSLLKDSLRKRGIIPTLRKIFPALANAVYDEGREFVQKSGTAGTIPLKKLRVIGNNREHGVEYSPTRYRLVRKVLAELEPEFQGRPFIDLGCGKGRVLWLAFESGFTKLVGVEFSPELCEEARAHLARRRIMAEIHNQDAADYEIPDTAAVFYLFNPFDAIVMERVIENILSSVAKNPRAIRIIYVNAIHGRLFENHGFKAVKFLAANGFDSVIYSL